MNERIRDFGKQAYNAATEIWPINSQMWYEVYNTTFAELIVRECIEVVEDCSIEYATRPQIMKEIKEHFGVDGMSTEDKKTLIKELLGVKNND